MAHCCMWIFFCVFDKLSSLFTLPQDMIHIADTKVARRYGDFFIRQIHKFEEVSSHRFLPLDTMEYYILSCLLF